MTMIWQWTLTPIMKATLDSIYQILKIKKKDLSNYEHCLNKQVYSMTIVYVNRKAMYF